jgi:hypothetical protein
MLDDAFSFVAVVVAVGQKGKKGKEAETGAKSTLTSDVLRDKCLKGLCDILRSHIKPLWDSSLIDEQFVK